MKFSVLIHTRELIYNMRRRKRPIEYNDVQFYTWNVVFKSLLQFYQVILQLLDNHSTEKSRNYSCHSLTFYIKHSNKQILEISLSRKRSVDKHSDNLSLEHALVYPRQPRRSRNRFRDGACASMMSYARSKFIDL
ncbi:hypothetical protein ALC60_01288 [Trachymyrmex zeteki]|uniref:Uncharacterized protein n=1 Tax=Mycetomoellerius zeteki TaxID=64791 RepID=A0A151XGT7_9HYME|nr:hypothetical protein ALC60_01288 [Trachymyrmex zeteki]